MIGAQSDLIGMDVCCLGPMIGDESEGPMTHTSLVAKSVFGSIAGECAAYGAWSIHTSLDGTICSGLRARVTAGAISRKPSDGRAKSCPS